MLGFGCTAVKYVLWIANFLIFVAGLGVLALGIWVKVDLASFVFTIQKLPINNYQLEAWTQTQVLNDGVYTLIAVGGFFVILGFLGCCGASRENRCFLLLYGIIVLLVALVLAIGTGVVFGFKDQLLEEGRLAMDENLMQEYEYSTDVNKTNIPTNVLNLIMTELRCCGVSDYTDFQRKAPNWPRELVVPAACCRLQDKTSTLQPVDSSCQTNPTPANSYMNTGCYDKIVRLVKDNLMTVLGAIIGLIVLLLIASTFAFMLFNAVNRSSRRAKYMDSYYSESPYSSSTAVGRGPRRRRSRRSLADERGGSSVMRTRSSHGAVPVVAYYPVEALNPAMRMPSQHAGLVRVGSQQQQQPVVVVNVAPQGSYQQYPC